ncbi:MAG TPA: beta-propeller fold lactonase family protein [Pyrinomonadaceae bacterium]|nr:beta-propeller fold lactonase family protein [Pyrinomonadaceae bacterium]
METIRNLNQRRSGDGTRVKQTRWALYLLLSTLLFSLPASTNAASNQATIFGPKTYTRTTGRPNSFQENFTATNISSSFTLIVQNGDGGENRINSARIILNGVEVVGPSDLNPPMDSIRIPVTVLENNTMTVELRSRPGSFITISIVRDNGYVYVNNNISGPNTVSAFSVNANGALTLIAGSPFATGGSGVGGGFFAANRMAIGTVRKLLFAANEQTNNISVFSIDPATGALTLVPGAPFPTGGVSNAGISLGVTPDNQFLFASSAGSNNITVFNIAANGTLTSISGSPFAVGGIPDGIKVSPDGRFLSVAVISSDAVGIFAIASSGALTAVPGSPFPAAALGSVAGVEINCASNLVFGGEAVLEGTNINVFSLGSNGALAPIPGSPFNNQGSGNNSNVVVLSPSDRHLFVSNQISDTITVFDVASDGALSLVPGSPFADPGGSPEMMATNEEGTLLYANKSNGAVSVFRILVDGQLTPVPGSPFTSGQPGSPGIASFPSKACSQN